MKQFKAYLQSKDLSIITQKNYIRNVKRFLQWCKQEPLNIETKHVLKYLDYLQNKLNYQNITRKNQLIALNHYFIFIERPAVTSFIKLNAIKKQRLQYIFTTQELEQLYDDYYNTFIQNAKPESNQLTNWRNYTMLGMLVYQGLKTNELDDLTLSDLNLQKATLTIKPKGKRGAIRTLYLQASQVGSLMYYLQTIRPQFTGDSDCQKLFLPLAQQRFKGSNDNLSITVSLRHLTKNLKKLHKNYTKLSQLRASAITHWIKNLGLRKAQYLAGHKSIVSTEEYVQNDLEALTDDLSKYHPFE